MLVVLKRISQRHIRLILEVCGFGGDFGPARRDQGFVSRTCISWCIVWCILPCSATLATPGPAKLSVGFVRQVPDETYFEKRGR